MAMHDTKADKEIVEGNKNIGIKMVLHTTLGLYINDQLYRNNKINWKVNRIIEECARAETMNIKWATLHLGTKDGRQRSDVIDNVNYILEKIQPMKIGILLENSASNNCFGATVADLMDILDSIKQELRYKDKKRQQKQIGICFDTQHFYAAGCGKMVHEYRNVLYMYGKEIMLIHINNSPPECTFGKGMDRHAHLLDPTSTISQEVYQMIAQHKEVCAMILETPSTEVEDQLAQIQEVQKLREYANDLLPEIDEKREQWSREIDQQNNEIPIVGS